MELWVAALILFLASAGVVTSLMLAKRKGKSKWIRLVVAAAGVLMAAALTYILLTIIFLDAL